MSLNFCTLFNTGYLARGLAMYHSLRKHNPDSHLYVFAFDDPSYEYLRKENLPGLTVISLREFEDEELLRIKPTRTAGEYCWTCTASTIRYAIRTFNLPQCTYLDADMYFYADPKVLLDELGTDSVIITEHRYSPAYDQSEISGKYCVQFVTFNNDDAGMKVLENWRNACIDWCYARVEDGKFGDQKYLDAWTSQFKGVHELRHLGGGLAPWNMQQYRFHSENGTIKGLTLAGGKTFDAVFFHFHGLRLYKDGIVSLTGDAYEMNDTARDLFFFPYVKTLLETERDILKKAPALNPNGRQDTAPKKPMDFLSLLRWYQYDVRQSLSNIGGKQTRNRRKHHHYYFTDSIV
ncbi:MAG: glycosyl transferase [Bacteroidetes bacterium]|nr:glycosyl transferase [Bacteroidota bacterium]